LSYKLADALPIVDLAATAYYGIIPPPVGLQAKEAVMMRLFPVTWAVLNAALASAATYLLVATDLLNDASVFLIH
jgi:hypothetical protein